MSPLPLIHPPFRGKKVNKPPSFKPPSPPPYYSSLINDRLYFSQTGKPWTPELFLECYCVARRKPIKCEKTKPQARTLISLWFCGRFACLDLCCDWSKHNKHSWDISRAPGFSGRTVINHDCKTSIGPIRDGLFRCWKFGFAFGLWLHDLQPSFTWAFHFGF